MLSKVAEGCRACLSIDTDTSCKNPVALASDKGQEGMRVGSQHFPTWMDDFCYSHIWGHHFIDCTWRSDSRVVQTSKKIRSVFYVESISLRKVRSKVRALAILVFVSLDSSE